MIKKKYDKKKILDYLKNNPNFFVDNPFLLDDLNFPRIVSNVEKNVISFKDWIISGLRKKQKKIIQNAEYNYFNQKRVYEAILLLMEIDNLKSLLDFTTKKLAKKLFIDSIQVVSSSKSILKYGGKHIREDILNSIFSKNQYLLMDAVDDKLEIFSSESEIYSNAIFLLEKKIFDSSFIIAFGSKEKLFINNKGSELIIFLSKVFEKKCIQLIKNES